MIKFLQFITLSTVLVSTHSFSADPSDIGMMTERQAWHAANSSAAKNRRLQTTIEEKDKTIARLQQQINNQKSLFIVGSLAHKAQEAAHKEAKARQELIGVLEQLAAEQARVAQLTEDLEAAQARIAKLEERQAPSSPLKRRTTTAGQHSPSKVTVTRTRTTVEVLFPSAASPAVAPPTTALQEHGQPPQLSSFGRASDGILGISTDNIFEDDDSIEPRVDAKRSNLKRSTSSNTANSDTAKRPCDLSRGEKAARTRKENAQRKAAQGSRTITAFFKTASENGIL